MASGLMWPSRGRRGGHPLFPATGSVGTSGADRCRGRSPHRRFAFKRIEILKFVEVFIPEEYLMQSKYQGSRNSSLTTVTSVPRGLHLTVFFLEAHADVT